MPFLSQTIACVHSFMQLHSKKFSYSYRAVSTEVKAFLVDYAIMYKSIKEGHLLNEDFGNHGTKFTILNNKCCNFLRYVLI